MAKMSAKPPYEQESILNLIRQVQKFCDARDWTQFHGPKELAIGLTTESAELLELFRFKSDQECLSILANKSSRKRVEEELSDIFFFVLRFSQLYKVDLPSAFRRKMAINKKRYPVRLAKGKNRKYSEYEK